MFKTKRADDLKEALNLIEEMNHKNRLENLIVQGNEDASIDRQMQWYAQQDLLEETQKTNDMLYKRYNKR